MSNTGILTFASLAGVLIGLVFYGGLWWTIRKGLAMGNPAWLFSLSLLLRVGIVLTGFILVSAGHWERMAACLMGFFVARLAVTRWVRTPPPSQPASKPRIPHAP